MRAAVLLLVPLAIACSDPPPPVEVSAGRLTARIYPDPPRIALVLDGEEVWSTRGDSSGGDGAPDGFAAIGSRATTVEMQFGSYKFTANENNESWQSITELTDITATGTGATFKLRGSDRDLGTGALTFVTATRSGLDPDAAGFPRHVRIELASPNAERIQIASTCDEREHLAGLGGQSFDVDHRGETVPLWVQEDGIGKYPDDDDSYQGVWFLTGRKHSTHTPMPMLLSSRGYALAVDTDARAIFDLCDSHPDAARFEAWSNELDLQVFIGEPTNPTKDAFGHMIAWVGKPPRPPELIFAPWVDALFGSDNVRRVAQKLRDNDVSASVIWTEDWRGGGNSATGYALHENWRVDRTLYPDFEQLAADLHGMGYAFHTYHNTFIDSTADIRAEAVASGFSIKNADGTPYEFTGVKFNPSTLLDLSNSEAVAWGKRVMTEAFALGSDGWMADFAEWLPHDATLASGEDPMLAHNRYPVDWARMNQDMFASTPSGRPPRIYFMRSAWLHSQPHVQVMWAGDQQTDWSEGDGYPSVIPIGLGMGLAGLPYFGHDIGGYMSQSTVSTSEELFYRWTTLGALSPVMRTHHGRNVTTNVQWEYDAGTLAHFKLWTNFHLQLATYLWGSIGSYERDGLPLFRYIALDYPGEDWAWTAVDEYLLGDRILVAPILQQGATSRRVMLPAGSWRNLFDGTDAGTGDVEATADRSGTPAFVPAGSLLVLYGAVFETMLDAPQSVQTTTKAQLANSREVWLYPGTAANADHANWNDDTGPVGNPHFTWSGRTPGALPTSATFNGSAVALTPASNYVRVVVDGNGTLTFDDGSTLSIARATPGQTTVKLF